LEPPLHTFQSFRFPLLFLILAYKLMFNNNDMTSTSAKPVPYRKLYEDILKGINPSSDFTIRCGNREFKVNKGFLFPRSEYFNTICNGSFRVCGGLELGGRDKGHC
jgi:hypothetical protein